MHSYVGRRTRRLALIAVATALALFAQIADGPRPAEATESELGEQLQEIVEQAETDAAAAIESLQDVLADIPGDFARGLDNLLAGVQALPDAEWFSVMGEILVGLVVIVLIALIGVPLCELLPFCTVF